MTCSEYVELFSEIHDRVATDEVVRAAEDHLASCEACRRYRHVLAQGAALLRSLPEPRVNEDFTPRLQHRIYHVDADDALRRHTNSGATAMAVLGMAVLLVAVAWAPALRPSAPEVALAPIVVSAPPAIARARATAAFSAFAVSRPAATSLQAGLWGDARTVLFEYSRLARRYGQRPADARSGLQQEQ